MNKKPTSHLEDELSRRIDYGVKAGVRDALIEHKRLGKSIVIEKDGDIIEIPADEIEIPDEPEKDFD